MPIGQSNQRTGSSRAPLGPIAGFQLAEAASALPEKTNGVTMVPVLGPALPAEATGVPMVPVLVPDSLNLATQAAEGSIDPSGSQAPALKPAVTPRGAPAADPQGLYLRLPGALNHEHMLNSNHPEMVVGPGVAVSTLPMAGAAHLDHAFQGDFEVFAHHQNRSGHDLQQAVCLYNSGPTPVTITVGASASTTTGECSFHDPSQTVMADPNGTMASGPGDRTALAVLRGQRAIAAHQVVVAPGATVVLHQRVVHPRDEVSSLYQLHADGPIHAAVLFGDRPLDAKSAEAMLRAGTRLTCTANDPAPGPNRFGRVAGVQEGTRWESRLTNDEAGESLVLGDQELNRSYLIDGLRGKSLDTAQDQAAPILVGYPDSASEAHGNYGVEYRVTVPLRNDSPFPRPVSLYFDTPWGDPQQLSRSFRGEVAIDDPGKAGPDKRTYLHLSHKPGTIDTTPFYRVMLPPGASREVQLSFIYPADASPPQTFRIVSPAPADWVAKGRDRKG